MPSHFVRQNVAEKVLVRITSNCHGFSTSCMAQAINDALFQLYPATTRPIAFRYNIVAAANLCVSRRCTPRGRATPSGTWSPGGLVASFRKFRCGSGARHIFL